MISGASLKLPYPLWLLRPYFHISTTSKISYHLHFENSTLSGHGEGGGLLAMA
jgi:hypothetical protein